MKITLSIGLLLLAGSMLFAQDKALVPKVTTASDALNQAARNFQVDSVTFQAQLKEAKEKFASDNKALLDELAAVKKELEDRLKADKKYKPLLDKISNLQTQYDDIVKVSDAEFQNQQKALFDKAQKERNQIDILTNIVKSENNFPSAATYDQSSQKWSLVK